MKKSVSKKIPQRRRANDAAKPAAKPAGSFLHRPAGVVSIALVLFAVTVATFIPALKNGFQIFDEAGELMNNTHMHGGLSWDNLRWALFSLEYSNWYPLTWISQMLDFKMFGMNPWGHHLTSVLLHAANGVLLFLVLKQMTGALWRSLIVAALFALHPLRVESVAWISERKDVLSAFFALLALLAYAKHVASDKWQVARTETPTESILSPVTRHLSRFYWLSLLFFAFALMSKSMVVTFPFLLLLLDYWPLRRVTGDKWQVASILRLVLEKAPFFLLVVPVSIAVYFAQKGGGQFLLQFPFGFRLETALMSYARYLGKMVWPANFSVLYPYPNSWPAGELLFAAMLILAISIAAVVLRRQRPYVLVGWLWYLGMLAPVIGLIPLGAESMSNRYTYLPMIGILVMVVWGVGDMAKSWRPKSVVAAMVTALILGACIYRTRAEIVYWKDGITLWSRATAVITNNFMAHYCLALNLSQSYPDRALAEFEKSVSDYPDYGEAQREYGLALGKSGRYAEAAVHFEKAVQLEPQNSWSHYDLGLTLLNLGRASDAVLPFLKAIEVEPQSAENKDALAALLFSSGHDVETISNFLATAQSDPAGFGLFLDAMQSDTNHVLLINNLALALATNPDPKLRNGRQAVRLATRACEMTGYQTNFCVLTLAAAFAENSQFDEAVSNAQLACSLTAATGQPELLKQYQDVLEQFRAHQTYNKSTGDAQK